MSDRVTPPPPFSCEPGSGSDEVIIHSAREGKKKKEPQLPRAKDAINEYRVHILLHSSQAHLT